MVERLPWHEEEEFIARTILLQITQLAKFNEMDAVAVLLANLKQFHRACMINIVD